MPNPHQRKTKKSKSRAEFIDFEEIFDGEVITREGMNVCPFGKGLVCNAPGCMVCAEGARCCSPGETCTLADGSINWCTGFRGSNTDVPRGGEMSGLKTGINTWAVGRFAPDPKSFWEH